SPGRAPVVGEQSPAVCGPGRDGRPSRAEPRACARGRGDDRGRKARAAPCVPARDRGPVHRGGSSAARSDRPHRSARRRAVRHPEGSALAPLEGQVVMATRATTAGGLTSYLGFDDEIERLRAELAAWLQDADVEVREALHWQFGGGSKYFRPL